MMIHLPNEVKTIFNKFESVGYQIYIVGGAVRDLLMGKEVLDWDFTTDAQPEEILKLFQKDSTFGEPFYDNKFGTVGIPIKTTSEVDQDTSEVYEITTMRKEGVYQDFRHPLEVSWTNKIEEDLGRRDFTINAMALGFSEKLRKTQNARRSDNQTIRLSDLSGSPSHSESFRIIDPFNGQKDIQDKLIRAVGNPDLRFQEDALRLMRAIRIAAEIGFEIDKNTFQAIQRCAHLIKEVSSERVRDELLKILGSASPYMGVVLLRKAEILQIILPEIEKCFGVVQEGPKHARVYDIGQHLLLTLKETPSSDPITRLAALLHDLGKPETIKTDGMGNVTFYHHEVVSAKLVLKIAKRFNLSKEQTNKLSSLVRWHLFTVDEKQTDSAIRRFIKNVGRENIEEMIALRIGDRLGGGTQKAVSWRMEKFKEKIKEVLKKPFTVADLKVNGHEVMKILNIPPGQKVGEVLNKLFEEVLKDSSKNNREYLLEKIKSLK